MGGTKEQSVMEQISRTAEMIGAAIRRRRKAMGMTQQGLAAAIALRQATVSHLESGDRGTKLGTVLDTLAALDLEIVIRPRTKGDATRLEDIF